MLPKLGLIAGGGLLPAEIIKSCLNNGRSIFVVALKDHIDPGLTLNLSKDSFATVRLGAAGKSVKLLRQAGVDELVMAGSVNRPSLLQLVPDLWTAKFLFKSAALSFGDDGLLRRLITTLENDEGFRVVGADNLLQHLLVKEGALIVTQYPEDFESDLKVGIKGALALGEKDIGQAVVVQDGIIIAEEGPDGTDGLLEQVTSMKERPVGGILVKMMKPVQERRVDLPAFGPNTLLGITKARLSGIAIEAGNAFILDKEKVIEIASRNNLIVHGISAEQATSANG